ncbi:PadR family transcriptional regulator [Rouxiella badensis]|jgi:DNA-binding PadR family transcriptional regulator|uniref:PadR family transcriptional regulator n=1 Tax=Rouxiella badensis TaxID=1646377 RepID=UPI001D1531E5|nr:PadR family transcriptional regulator [Rouxiella badensis]MCC3731401.1 PadR family transcriptional regulator [Rouxiella badensis]MCC3756790.1 PadR family transcriptional regulator [Rouxiella badensis]
MRKTSAIHTPNKKMPERRGKTFKNEELLLLILYFVRLNTTHGYEIIKSIAHYSMGAYSPSPGVIYPNLTLLEELGYAVAQAVDGSKKKYTITRSGEHYLEQHKQTVVDALERLKALELSKHPVKNPEIYYAIENLKTSVKIKMRNENITQDEVEKISRTIQEATKKINEA